MRFTGVVAVHCRIVAMSALLGRLHPLGTPFQAAGGEFSMACCDGVESWQSQSATGGEVSAANAEEGDTCRQTGRLALISMIFHGTGIAALKGPICLAYGSQCTSRRKCHEQPGHTSS